MKIMFSKELKLMEAKVRLAKLSQFPVENKRLINKMKRRIRKMEEDIA